MSRFLGIIQNENMKIYRRLRTWIMVGILIVFVGFVNFASSTLGDVMMQYPTSMDAMVMSAQLVSFAAMFCVIVAGTIVSSEFGWGTIKLLLIRPISRTKVLLAKYIAVLTFTLFILIVLFFISYIYSLIFYDAGDSNLTFTDILTEYAFTLPDLIFSITIAFMISAVFRSSALAIGISIFLMTIGKQLIFGLIARYDWAKYVLYMNTELSQYRNGRLPMIEGMSMGFSITVLIIYFVTIIALTWWFFTKRDVTN